HVDPFQKARTHATQSSCLLVHLSDEEGSIDVTGHTDQPPPLPPHHPPPALPASSLPPEPHKYWGTADAQDCASRRLSASQIRYPFTVGNVGRACAATLTICSFGGVVGAVESTELCVVADEADARSEDESSEHDELSESDGALGGTTGTAAGAEKAATASTTNTSICCTCRRNSCSVGRSSGSRSKHARNNAVAGSTRRSFVRR
ncbi:unnamed protein product, partial [Mycena citricolor]